MSEALSGPRARIDLAALRHNLAFARRHAPDAKLLAVIKADAYGHGLLPVARALADADALAVARLEEALRLREAGIRKDIVLLEGVNGAGELRQAQQHGLQPVVHRPDQIQMLQQAGGEAVSVWLKIDTGMHRLGFAPAAAAEAHRQLAACAAVRGTPRLMTHLACADERDNEVTRQQCRRFDAAVAGLAGEQSIANSAGLLGWPDTRRDWVRPGIMLYGASPFADGSAADLRPVMSLETALIALRDCRRGEPVGYGGRWRCPEDMRIGVAAIGYGDGYPRHAPDGTPVRVNGKPAAIAGRVSMDMIALDLRACPGARVGDPVLLWGRGETGERLPVETIAARAGTLSYELFCRLTPRLRFVYE